MTRKEFREWLNRDFAEEPKHRNYRFQQRTRPYGDYLWFQDREKFEADYQEHLKTLAERGFAPSDSSGSLVASCVGTPADPELRLNRFCFF